MTLTKDDKTEIIGQYARSEGDTGSAEVQVAVLTKRIADLTEHLKLHTEGPCVAPGSAPDGRPTTPAPGIPQA